MPPRAVRQIFLISPASCSGERAALLLSARAGFDLARRVRTPAGAPLGEVMSFLSGLYFRGKLAYARAFARPPAELPGVLVISPAEGLRSADEPVTAERLRAWAAVPIALEDPRYLGPLRRHADALARGTPPRCRFVLLGSLATDKYLAPLGAALGPRLHYPPALVGRGDMSRGSILLRAARAGEELAYAPAVPLRARRR